MRSVAFYAIALRNLMLKGAGVFLNLISDNNSFLCIFA